MSEKDASPTARAVGDADGIFVFKGFVTIFGQLL